MNTITIARPYAKAVFEIALESKTLQDWDQKLNALSQGIKDPQIREIVKNPTVEKDQLVELLLGLCVSKTNSKRKSKASQSNSEGNTDQLKSLLNILAKNNRLSNIAEVYTIFSQLKKEHEELLEVFASSAFELSSQDISQLKELLSSKFGKNIEIKSSVDKSLIGGVRLQIGDQIFDASIKAKLQNMRLTIS